MGVTEHQPASQRRVRAGQLALDRVLSWIRTDSRLSSPFQVKGAAWEQTGQVSLCKINLEKSNKSLTLLAPVLLLQPSAVLDQVDFDQLLVDTLLRVKVPMLS